MATPNTRGFERRAVLAKPVRTIRRRIGERHFARHHFREQTARDWAERQPVMIVSERKPQTAMPRGRPDHRTHVGRAGAHA